MMMMMMMMKYFNSRSTKRSDKPKVLKHVSNLHANAMGAGLHSNLDWCEVASDWVTKLSSTVGLFRDATVKDCRVMPDCMQSLQ
jgi:hypothetical protein